MKHERLVLCMALFSLLTLLVIGTFLFQAIEGWHFIDAFYFSAMTMLTVGYGDITPQSFTGKIAAVMFAFVGVGIALYSVNMLARLTFKHSIEDARWLKKK